MEQNKTTFIKHKLPCNSCGGSDPVSMNEDGSAYCFSCSTFFPDYKKSEGVSLPVTKPKENNTFLTSYSGIYGALTDRGISKETAI